VARQSLALAGYAQEETMIDSMAAPPCGYTCGECSHFKKDCPGCRQTNGTPFWIPKSDMKKCNVYDCCGNQKGLEHCGLCPQLPCDTFLKLRDPSMSDQEFENSLNERKAILLRRAQKQPANLGLSGRAQRE
jgi:hypothetical protein